MTQSKLTRLQELRKLKTTWVRNPYFAPDLYQELQTLQTEMKEFIRCKVYQKLAEVRS